MHQFHHFLKNRIKKPLPGREAQLKMSPEPLDPDFVLPIEKTESAHPSSVLIPLFPDDNNLLNVILTLRTNSIRHAGQISFPGGRKDNGETLLQTALRETNEEIGINPLQLTIAGSITPLYLHRTDNQITPFVGFMDKKPVLTPNPAEVQETIITPLKILLQGERYKRKEWNLKTATFDVPYWDIHETPLWGATAMIMSELLELYREFEEQD